MSGPLTGLKVIELAGLGPAPFCGMLLADMGADVICIDRHGKPGASGATSGAVEILRRGRRSIALDLKDPADQQVALRLVDGADVVLEGFRPGVMERMGLGPDLCLSRNRKLVYGRMTGWGQYGPLSEAAGHDINYIALSGALHAIGPADCPVVPLNLVGDFGGGAVLFAFGLMCAVFEARRSGQGQVVDAAMTDGSALLMTMMYGLKADGSWSRARADNLLDGGAPFYGTYRCADGRWIAIGSIEPQFYSLLLSRLGLPEAEMASPRNKANWPGYRQRFAEAFEKRTRAEWCQILEGTDVCFAPVLDMDEAPDHPHNVTRKTFCTVDGVLQPSPAPRFSRTPASIRCAPPPIGADTHAILTELDEAEASSDLPD